MTEAKGTRTSAIDWPSIRRRMQNVATLEQGAAAAPAQKAQVFKARARALARAAQPDARPGEHLQVIEFMLAYERYALDVAFVREVHSLKELTPLPGTPAFVAGIVNVRGEIVSVVDLKRFFDLPRQGLTDLNKVIILNDHGTAERQMQFGLLVDAVISVHWLALNEIQSSLPTLTAVRARYLLGVTTQRVVVLDAMKILADPTVVVRDETPTTIAAQAGRERNMP